jgi:ribosomal protein S18 acetylase RimI-like enzyme
MLKATIVTMEDELVQIHKLNQQNLKQNINNKTQEREGFVTWLYSLELLRMMHKLSPSIIVKDKEKVVAYALTTLKESKAFHPDLKTMFGNLESVQYKNKPLSSSRFYCMGQICIAKEYRGKGIVAMLYQQHKEVYGRYFDFLLTEISINNRRSLKAHEKIGFQTIYTYKDAMDEWEVVIWDWN